MNKDDIYKKLESVKDPEIGLDIVSLGLIRELNLEQEPLKKAHVLMTLTTPFCPFANDLIQQVEDTLEKEGFEDVAVELTFDPPWEPPAELRAQLGL